MTREDAIAIIKFYDSETYKPQKIKEALYMAIEDMEKQIPKKPMEVITDDNEFICIICPSCQEISVEFNDRFCRRCGQALDWSEEDE